MSKDFVGFSLCVALLVIRLCIVHAYVEHSSNIFDTNICKVMCNGRVHTMCEDKITHECPYKNFELYNVDTFTAIDLKILLVHGHNGLRDRIAHRMGVVNMNEVMWDHTLEMMANKYLKMCRPYQDDDCANFNQHVDFQGYFKSYLKGRDGYDFVSQNRFCIQADYFPRNFIESTMRSWYFDKNFLKPPSLYTEEQVDFILKKVYGENNFTHMAYPFVNRFGCSAARFDRNYCIFCFYYPFYRSEISGMTYEYGKPASKCPSYVPLRSEEYPGLCTAEIDKILYNSEDNISFPDAYIFILLFVIFVLR